jgi:predicted porin
MQNKYLAIALGVFALEGHAIAADTNVNLYGKIDAFAEYDTGGDQGDRASFESGGISGTRWGVKGDTSLASIAPEMKAIFQLEGGLFVNNGRQAQSSRLFGRQAYVGVAGGFGTLTLGRQYTPLLNTVVGFDAFGQGYGSPTNDGQVSTGLDARYDNSLIYATPTLGGFSATAMLALDGKTGRASKDRAEAISVDYTAGPLDIGAVWQRDDHDLATNGSLRNIFVGGSYKLGIVKVSGGYGNVRSTTDGAGSARRDEWLLGATFDVTSSGQLWLDYGTGHTRSGEPSDRSSAYSVAWMQSLTKQARAYVAASVHTNDDGSALVPMGTSSYGSYTVNPGNTATGLALGFQYDF